MTFRKEQHETDLAALLSPVSLAVFLQDYWEKQPLFIERRQADFFAEVLSVSDLERLFATQALYFPRIQLSRADNPVPVPEYADGDNRIDPRHLTEWHHRGASIVISQAESLFPKLGELVNNLQADANLRCQANVYLTPPGNQGFKAHYDTHDVFVCQVSGHKTFRFYEGGVDLPFVEDSFDSTFNIQGQPVEVVTLQAGDTLYIPRGVVHDAIADHDPGSGLDPSLHITLGMFAVVVRDVLQAIVQAAAVEHPELRASVTGLSPGAAKAHEALDKKQWQHWINLLASDTFFEQARSGILDNLAVNTLPAGQGLLSPSAQASALQAETRIKVNNANVLSADPVDAGSAATALKLRLRGRVLTFHAPLSVAVGWLLHKQTFRVSQLPDLQDDARVALLSQLINEGVCVVDDTTPF